MKKRGSIMKLGGKKTVKFFIYLSGKVLAALLVFLLCLLAFYTAENTADVNVTVKDAFSKRASVILKPLNNQDTELLTKVFTEDYLKKSRLDTQKDNRFYDVSLYMQRTDVELKVVLSTSKRAVISVTDIIEDVRASLVNEDDPEFVPKNSLIDSGRYNVTVLKTKDGSWMIDDIECVETIIPEDVRPLPTPAPSGEVPDEKKAPESEEDIFDTEE